MTVQNWMACEENSYKEMIVRRVFMNVKKDWNMNDDEKKCVANFRVGRTTMRKLK